MPQISPISSSLSWQFSVRQCLFTGLSDPFLQTLLAPRCSWILEKSHKALQTLTLTLRFADLQDQNPVGAAGGPEQQDSLTGGGLSQVRADETEAGDDRLSAGRADQGDGNICDTLHTFNFNVRFVLERLKMRILLKIYAKNF